MRSTSVDKAIDNQLSVSDQNNDNTPHTEPPQVHPPTATTATSKSKKSFIPSNNYSLDASLNHSISNSAPTVLVRTPLTSPSQFRSAPLRSAMSSRTLHESLHRGGRTGKKPKGKRVMNRSVSFANINIREYERVLGDNPSVTSGPPLSIGWRYAPEPISMRIDDYEDGKGEPRSSSEYLVPKTVRENMLRDHADVSRREMVAAVRAIQKEKAQRRKTVVNLSMHKTEEKVEGAKHKLKKILKPSSSYESEEARLWDEAHAVAMEKAKQLEESIRRGESVSMKNFYAVGTPCNNILPSRKNSMGDLFAAGKETEEGMGESKESVVSSAVLESGAKLFSPMSAAAGRQVRRLSSGGGEQHHDQHGGAKRTSSSIVACESESEEIFARLVLDS
ncbi:hypothetical protein ACHAXR_007143 [Thalassiosira sp. AJA248-18]